MNAGVWKLLSRQERMSGMTAIDFDSLLTDEFTFYELRMANVTMPIDGCYVCMRFGQDNLYSDAGSYSFVTESSSPSTGDWDTYGHEGWTALSLTRTPLMPSSAASNFSVVTLVRSKAGYISATWDGMFETSGGNMDEMTGGGSSEINAFTSAQILPLIYTDENKLHASNVTINGDFSLYGLVS